MPSTPCRQLLHTGSYDANSTLQLARCVDCMKQVLTKSTSALDSCFVNAAPVFSTDVNKVNICWRPPQKPEVLQVQGEEHNLPSFSPQTHAPCMQQNSRSSV